MPLGKIKKGKGCVKSFVSKEVPHLMHKGYSQSKALGASYHMARSYCAGEKKKKLSSSRVPRG